MIDEAALTRMLRNKQLAGAGLDVFEHEPAINPSCASSTTSCCCRTWARPRSRAAIDMGEKVVINIKTFVDGHRPPDRVLPSQL